MQAYLICSESFRLIEEEVNKIIKNNHNVISYDMNEATIEDLLNEAAYISLLDEKKYLIAKNAHFFGSEKLKEEDSERLISYLNNPNDQTILIFTTTTKLDVRKKITKLLKDKYEVIEIPKLKEYELNNKIMSIFKKDGYQIDFEAIKYISESCLLNYDLIYNEIAKIKLYYNDEKNIKLNDLKKLVSPSIEDNIFKLINAIMEKNYAKSLKLFNDLKILKEEPIAFISLLAKEYRNTYLIKTTNDKTSLTELLKIQNWQYEKYERYAYSYDTLELKNKLQELYNLDLDIKTGKIDKYLGFELFLLNI